MSMACGETEKRENKKFPCGFRISSEICRFALLERHRWLSTTTSNVWPVRLFQVLVVIFVLELSVCYGLQGKTYRALIRAVLTRKSMILSSALRKEAHGFRLAKSCVDERVSKEWLCLVRERIGVLLVCFNVCVVIRWLGQVLVR